MFAVQWFAESLEDYLKGQKNDFYNTLREGARSFIVQRCSNASGQYMALVKYGNGGRHNFICILEAMDGMKMACALRKGSSLWGRWR